MKSSTLYFNSDQFKIIPNEDRVTYPGTYGKSLSNWLYLNLLTENLIIDYPFAKDCGWLISVLMDTRIYHIACANQFESEVDWQVFVMANESLFGRILYGSPDPESIDKTYQIIKRVLMDDPTIHKLQEQSC